MDVISYIPELYLGSESWFGSWREPVNIALWLCHAAQPDTKVETNKINKNNMLVVGSKHGHHWDCFVLHNREL